MTGTHHARKDGGRGLAGASVIAAAAGLLVCVTLAGPQVFRWAVHNTGSDFGARYGHWVPYMFWSGVAGSFLIAVVAWFFGHYVHHTCHYAWWCPRWAHVPVAGGIAGTCHRHAPHPELNGRPRPRGKRLHELHHAWESRQRPERTGAQ